MGSMTLSIPPELKKRMAKHPEVKWSEVVRTIIRRQLDDWEEADRILSKSRLKQRDVDEIVKKVNRDMAKHVEELLHETRR